MRNSVIDRHSYIHVKRRMAECLPNKPARTDVRFYPHPGTIKGVELVFRKRFSFVFNPYHDRW